MSILIAGLIGFTLAGLCCLVAKILKRKWIGLPRLSDEDKEGMASEMDAMALVMRIGGGRADTPEAATDLWALADLMDDFARQLRDASSTLADTQKLQERFTQLTGEARKP